MAMTVQEETQKHIEVFCCYARKDQALLQELKNHLMPLKREGLITLWADTDINAGTEWEKEIHLHLNTSHIILLLVSPDFMASDYCYSTEMTRAMKRHQDGEAQVIPIILRPTDWQNAPFAKLQALPQDGRPIISSEWSYRDEGFANAAKGIRKAVEARLSKGERRHLKKEAEQTRFVEEARLRRAEKAVQVRRMKKEGQIDQRLSVYEENKGKRDEFITSTVKTYFFVINHQAFALLIGSGPLIAFFFHQDQNRLWSVGFVVLSAPLIYLLGYRKALHFLRIGLMGVVAAAITFGMTFYFSGLNFDHPVTSHLWFNLTRILWLESQVKFGFILGGILGIIVGLASARDFSRTDESEPAALIFGAYFYIFLIWFIIIILASIFQWGFGFGYGWDISLIVTVISYFTVMGFIYLLFVWALASEIPAHKLLSVFKHI